MIGHIKLGHTSATLKEYMLVDFQGRLRTTVNPMSVKSGAGAGEYDDFQDFNYWVSDDWRLGLGREDPSEGGFYFSTIDTRYESIAFLSPLLFPSMGIDQEDAAASWNSFGSISDNVTLGVGETYETAIAPFKGSGTLRYAWVWMQSGELAKSATLTLYSGANTSSLSSVATATADGSTRVQGWEWRRFDLGNQTLTGGTQYWIEVKPTSASETISLPVGTGSDYGGGDYEAYNGSAYTDLVTTGSVGLQFYFLTDVETMGGITAVSYFNGTLYAGTDDGYLWKLVKGSSRKGDYWTSVSNLGTAVTDMATWYGDLYIALGDGTTAKKCTTLDSVADVSPAWQADFLVVSTRGYLWKTEANTVSYTASATPGGNWTDITVTSDDYQIRGVADLDGDLIVSVDWALLAVGSGDAVSLLTRWPYESDTNGRGMSDNQGTAFIPLDNTLLQLQPNVPMTNIWSREQRLPSGFQGKIRHVIGTNRETMILVNSADAGGVDTVWSWNSQGWQFVAQLPEGQTGSVMFYDDSMDRIWVMTEDGIAWHFYPSTVTTDPPTDGNSTFMPCGWLDTNIFYGNLKAVTKDIESIEILGRGIDENTPITIYYQDDDAFTNVPLLTEDGEPLLTEDGQTLLAGSASWVQMGQFTRNSQRIRFDDPDTRPWTRGLRLGILIQSDNESVTPVLDSVVVRYRAMVVDRYGWKLPVLAADYQEGLDGGKDTRTAAEILAEIEGYNFGPPIKFIDINGSEYDVYVVGLADRPAKLHYHDGQIHTEFVIDLSIEEVDGALSD